MKKFDLPLDLSDTSAVIPFSTPSNYHHHEHDGEVNDMPSLFQPDMSMSVAELMFRYATNRPVPGSVPLMYTNDAEAPDMSRLDKLDQIDLLRENQARINELEDKMAEFDAAKKQRADAKYKSQLEELRELRALKDSVRKKADHEQRESEAKKAEA